MNVENKSINIEDGGVISLDQAQVLNLLRIVSLDFSMLHPLGVEIETAHPGSYSVAFGAQITTPSAVEGVAKVVRTGIKVRVPMDRFQDVDPRDCVINAYQIVRDAYFSLVGKFLESKDFLKLLDGEPDRPRIIQ